MTVRPAICALLLALGCTPASDRDLDTWTEPITGMEFVRLPAGRFQMGSAPAARGHEEGELLHEVTISRPFYLQRTEVTQEQWRRVTGANPAAFRLCGRDCPMESVSARDIERFVRALERLTDEAFRLPTEAEWEYACRAGGTAPDWPPADRDPSLRANVDARYPMAGDAPGGFLGAPAPVASYDANPWGLFDLQGNVWEWTADPWCPYPEGAVVDPRPTCPESRRVIRGGSWTFDVASARCETRYTHRPQDSGSSLGFRLVWPGRTQDRDQR